ncbi:MAG: F0F1 ATP synthase subunit A [Aquifex sp.]|nr:MAG: F0F1 ATP synthase subunit A [Aquifex sp.]
MIGIGKKIIIDLGHYQIGNIKLDLILNETVINSWIAMIILIILSILLTRDLKVRNPSYRQLFVETLIISVAKQIRGFSRVPVEPFLGFITTMWLFVGVSNLLGLVPFLEKPTADLSAVAGLSTITFLSIFYYGVKFEGISYFKHYLKPLPIFLPFNVIGESGRILALTFRLFGNMLGWEIILGILLVIAGLLVPVPLMLLSVVGDVIQAYIFGLLTLAYIIAGINVSELKRRLKNLEENWYEL